MNHREESIYYQLALQQEQLNSAKYKERFQFACNAKTQAIKLAKEADLKKTENPDYDTRRMDEFVKLINSCANALLDADIQINRQEMVIVDLQIQLSDALNGRHLKQLNNKGNNAIKLQEAARP